MNILTSLVKTNLTLNKKRTIVTIISIILSCALICGVATLVASFQRFTIDVEIETNGSYHAEFLDVPVEKTKYIMNNSYIKEATQSVEIGYSFLENSKSEQSPYLYIEAYDDRTFEIANYKLLSGRFPVTSDEVVINSYIESIGKVKYNIGDKIVLNIGNRYFEGEKQEANYGYNNYTDNGVLYKEELIITTTHTYTVVGIVEGKQEDKYNAGFPIATKIDNKLLSSIKVMDVRVETKNPKNIYEKLETVAKEAELTKDNYSGIEYHDQLLMWYGVTNNNDANRMLYGFALILIGVIMGASIIVIYNSFNISIVERKKQFGMLSSIGTTSRQIRNMVLKEGLFLSIIAIPLGILGGIIGIGIVLQVINNLDIFGEFYQTKLTLTVIPLSIYVTILFGGLTVFLSSLIPSIKASRTSPIDAIRQTSDIKIKGKKLRTPKIIRRLFGMEGELAHKNMKRNRKKYRSTIISLFVSIVMFMTVNAFAEYSLRSTMKVFNDFNFNIGVTANEKTINEVAKLENLGNYSIIKNVGFTLYLDEKGINPKILESMKKNNYDTLLKKYFVSVTLSTLGEKEFSRYASLNNVNKTDYIDPKNPKIIMMKKSNFFDLTKEKYYQIALTNHGKNSTMSLTNGDTKPFEVTVGELSSIYPIGFTNADGYEKNIQGFISEEVYNAIDDTLKYDGIMLMANSEKPALVMEEIELLAKNKALDIEAQNIETQIKMLKNIVLAISIFLYGFITLVSMITIMNVINTITTSIYLRRREFAMLKAVGMTNKAFDRMIRYESLLYGLKSLVYGLPIGIILDYVLFKNVSSMFIYDYAIPFKPIFVCMLFVFVIISITMAYSVRKIRNENIIDVIKQENQ